MVITKSLAVAKNWIQEIFFIMNEKYWMPQNVSLSTRRQSALHTLMITYGVVWMVLLLIHWLTGCRPKGRWTWKLKAGMSLPSLVSSSPGKAPSLSWNSLAWLTVSSKKLEWKTVTPVRHQPMWRPLERTRMELPSPNFGTTTLLLAIFST